MSGSPNPIGLTQRYWNQSKQGKIGNFEKLINEEKMSLQRCDLGCHYNILIKLTYVKCLPFMLSVVLPGFAQTQSWRAPDPEVCLSWLRHKTTGSAEWQQCCRLVSPFTSTKWLMKDSAIAPFLPTRILWLIMIDNFTNCPAVIMIRTDHRCLIVHLHQQGSILEPFKQGCSLDHLWFAYCCHCSSSKWPLLTTCRSYTTPPSPTLS